ncbi:hypothetical protein AKJ09_01174 [Labilithrix luteola]|uniref:Uncharacterized protein n=1 Tax=Labilithrix luteola TaxID=1391654 RepID=A0A0K1PLW0_9BACT|nr:hypothetical protein AKJ09_01174 [Labilithrix luteola]
MAEVIIPTVREYLPWHILERKLAERASGSAKRAEARAEDDVRTLTEVEAADRGEGGPRAEAPPSGIRVSDGWRTSEHDADVPPTSGIAKAAEADLTYQVYSVDDLARRRQAKEREAWLKKRETPPQFPVMSRPWALALARTIDWKKTAKKAGIVAGACSLFGFGMLTAAELTDDVRPGSSSSKAVEMGAVPQAPVARATSEVVTIPAAVPVRTIVFVPAGQSTPVPIPAVESAFEPVKAPQRVSKPTGKPKAEAEVFIP